MSTLVGAIFDDRSALGDADNTNAIADLGGPGTAFDHKIGPAPGVLVGTSDNDWFDITDPSNTIKEGHNGGIDIVTSSIYQYQLDKNLEDLILDKLHTGDTPGSGAVIGYGNNIDNVIV